MRLNLAVWLFLLLALVGLGACSPVQEEPGDDAGGVATVPPSDTTALTPVLSVTTTLTSTLPPAETLVPTDTVPVATRIVITATVPVTATGEAEPEETSTPTFTPTATQTSIPSPTPSHTPAPTASPTPTKQPTPTPTEGPPPTPTALPQTVFVTSHRSYTEGSDLFVVGEVVNGASFPAYGVRVIATFFDAGDRLLAAQESFAYLHETAPTQANPFEIQLPNSPANISRYDLNLSWDDISIVDYDRATITREENRDDEGVEVFGELRNDHPSVIKNLRVVATFYDAAGQVVNAYPGTVDVPALDPGGTTSFVIRTGNPDLQYESFVVQTQGILVH